MGLLKSNEKTNLGRSRIFQVPKFDVPVTHRHEVGAVLCKRDGLHLGRHLVGGHFDAATPIPYVDNHVVLRANRHHVLVVGRKSLKHFVRRNQEGSRKNAKYNCQTTTTTRKEKKKKDRESITKVSSSWGLERISTN